MNIFLAAAIIFGAVAIACLLMFAIHRLGTRDVFLADTTRGAGVYGVAGTAFAVLLAFVVVVAFEQYNNGKTASRAEADAVIELFRSADYFPRRDSREIQGDLVCYGQAVADQEWPAMGEGQDEPVPAVEQWVVRLQDAYQRLPVRNLRAQAAFASIIELRDDRIDARRERLAQAGTTVATPVWFVLILGALVNIGFVLLFIDRRNESFLAQASLIATVTMIVVAGLVLVWFLDHPYEGQSGSIEPTEMRGVVDLMLEEGRGLDPPCSSDGDPSPA
jgi:hypothetical protein